MKAINYFQIKELMDAGLSRKEVAMRFGISTATVTRRIMLHKSGGGKVTLPEMMREYDSGRNYDEIARKFKLYPSEVKRRIEKSLREKKSSNHRNHHGKKDKNRTDAIHHPLKLTGLESSEHCALTREQLDRRSERIEQMRSAAEMGLNLDCLRKGY